MSDNWVVQNLQKALATWNEKLQEIWTLLTVSPEEFKGGRIWAVILDVHSGIQAILKHFRVNIEARMVYCLLK